MKDAGGGDRKRPYRMKARAEAAQRTAKAILNAAAELWRDRGLDEMTLQDVADRAGVTVQTVIRRFGSKDGLIDAALRLDAGDIVAHRALAPPGDVSRALDVLLDHYEAWGEAALRTLALEERYPAAKKVVDRGRAEHRAWCARVLAPDGAGEETVDAVVAATDVYVWKRLRRDLGRSREETKAVMRRLVEGARAALPPGRLPARR